MERICATCEGKGYIEYPDYDWDENILDEGTKVVCMNCEGKGYIDER